MHDPRDLINKLAQLYLSNDKFIADKLKLVEEEIIQKRQLIESDRIECNKEILRKKETFDKEKNEWEEKKKDEMKEIEKSFAKEKNEWEEKKKDEMKEIEKMRQQTTPSLKEDPPIFHEESRMEGIQAGQDSIIELNVGGHQFTTSEFILLNPIEPNSLLKAMFSGRYDIEKDEGGNYFINRDGRQFHYILNYLRDPSKFVVPARAKATRELLVEAEYYQLENLVSTLSAKMKNTARNHYEYKYEDENHYEYEYEDENCYEYEYEDENHYEYEYQDESENYYKYEDDSGRICYRC